IAGRDLPSVDSIDDLTVRRGDLPPTPLGWTFEQDEDLIWTLPLPPDWSCDGEGPDLVQIDLRAGDDRWTWVGPWASSVTLPGILDPAIDPRPPEGFIIGEAAVHGTPFDAASLRTSPVLAQGPQAWLSASGQAGRVCTSRKSL
ncbi:MAG: hypothetical protein AAF211_29750, partial [Myxococcota bacterium]